MTNGTNAIYTATKKTSQKNDHNKIQLDHFKIKSLVDKNISAFAIYRIVQISLNDKLKANYKKVKISSEFSNEKLRKSKA